MVDYSVVVPVFNSASTLEALAHQFTSVFTSLICTYELIFVDDFSDDDSWSILQKLKTRHPDHIKLIRFARNYGQHNATFCGLQHATGNVMITIDDDLQYKPEDIVALIDTFKKAQVDLVYGVGKKQHSWWRKTGSKLLKSSSKRVQGGPGEGSSFRLISRKLVEQILNHNRHFIFLDEVFYWYTNHITFVTVPHYKREHGASGYSLGKLLHLVKESSLFYSTWPLKLMTLGGIVLSLVSFIAGVLFIILKLFYDVPVQGFTALIVTILFSTSLVLLCFGIIGGYIKHIYTVLNNKPMYAIAQKEL